MIKRTRDLELVRSVFTRPEQWEAATDDGAPRQEDFYPNADERVIYLEYGKGEGIFTLIPLNAVTFEIHAAIDMRKFKTATQALREAIAWAFFQTPALRVVGQIPETNRLAIALARAAGLTEYGRNPRSFLKHGQIVDTVQLGISI